MSQMQCWMIWALKKNQIAQALALNMSIQLERTRPNMQSCLQAHLFFRNTDGFSQLLMANFGSVLRDSPRYRCVTREVDVGFLDL